MKCKCGNEAQVFTKGQNLCWKCYDKVLGETGASKGLHIDKRDPRVQLCDGAPGDSIYHMTPGIAASYMAQHPDQQSEFCGGCLAVMYRDYLPIIEEARTYAATLK